MPSDNFSISANEFLKLLNNSALEQTQKDVINSIFTKISAGDGKLSKEEWERFIGEIDTNKNTRLEDTEFSNYAKTKFQNAKNGVINFYNIVTKYISNIGKPEKKSQNNSELVYYSIPNTHRYKSKTKGTFTGGWIARDKYNSQTYEEWIKNNGYEFNTDVGKNLEAAAKKRNNMHGQCAAATRYAMSDTTAISQQAFGFIKNQNTTQQESPNDSDEDNILNGEIKSTKLFNAMESQYSAYQYASELAKNPYFKEVPHNIVATMDLKTLPKGCIVVYDAEYKTPGKNLYGHIAVTDGNGFDSGGGFYPMATAKQATHIRVFIPIKIPEENV